MAEMFTTHLDWTGAAKGATHDAANGPDAVALIAKANELIDRAHDGCFIANSVTTAVTVEPEFSFAGVTSGGYVGT